MMDIPAKVREAAQPLLEMYGGRVEHLGEYQGADAFYYNFPDDVTAGHSPVYFYEDGKIDVLYGDVAYAVMLSCIENVDIVDIK